uniref:ATP synthase-coupling factor 6, mitochondrial n=1 Tax=Plectus sambesii TaxID=2011161 RepID=A0A914UUH6_9BILA
MFRQALTVARVPTARLLSTSSPMAQVAQKTGDDPVQQLFVQKIREYGQKSKAAGGKMVDVTGEVEKSLRDELSRVARTFGIASAQEASSLPAFKFDSTVDVEPFRAFTDDEIQKRDAEDQKAAKAAAAKASAKAKALSAH